MLKHVRDPAHLKFATACLTAAFVSIAAAPTVADEQFALKRIVQLPDSENLSAFDISFVHKHIYALAASRVAGSSGNVGEVIIVNTRKNVVIKELHSTPPFAPFVGNCSFPSRDEFSGPNGVIVIERGDNTDVWAADGPVFNTRCVPGSGVKTPSTVKVLDLKTGHTKAVIETGNGKNGAPLGTRRADELCFNPVSDVVLVANDDRPTTSSPSSGKTASKF